MKKKLFNMCFVLMLWFSPAFVVNPVMASFDAMPNILVIMADDVGHEVLGCYGGTSYATPNLDRLAAEGMRFTHCYSTPLCTPSRVKIMTGRYLFRTSEEWGYIPPEEITFGQVLQSAGYATALAGKWQMILLKEDPMHITKMGFQENCVFGWHEGPRYYKPLIYQNGKIRDDVANRYGPDVYADFLIDFMVKNRNKPFLAYYPMTLAHDVSNDLPEPPPVGPNGRYDTYREQVEYMDKLVGRLVDALDSLGLREKTLILFTGDNGTPKKFLSRYENGAYLYERVISMKGEEMIPGGKGELTDAGTHVPLIANWPTVTPEGTVCDDLIDFSDFLPTLAELAGANLPEKVIIDGKSFAQQILGMKGHPREWIYTQWQGRAWIRTKDWKLYTDESLYDLRTDPRERNPVLPAEDTEESGQARAGLLKYLKKLKNRIINLPVNLPFGLIAC